MKRLARCDVSEIINEVKHLSNFSYLDVGKISVVVSHGSKSNAYAKIYGLSREIQVGFSVPPIYTIEFLCEKIVPLRPEDTFVIFTHELLHIPKKFSGGLRPHGKYVNNLLARRISSSIDHRIKEMLYERLKSCCKSISDQISLPEEG